MRTLCLLCFSLVLAASAVAQEDGPKASKASEAYHMARYRPVDPPYGLSKVKRLVSRIKAGKDDDNQPLADRIFNTLSVPEKFTYVMIHCEDFAQNCDVMPVFVDEEKKIFAYPPDQFQENMSWSERERAFLKNHRAQVIGFLREGLRAQKHVGLNYKMAIVEIDGKELIPDIVAAHRRNPKDHDLLSLLMILMKNGKFEPFMKSQSYEKLYSDQASYQSFLMANQANQDLIVQRAMAFYNAGK